MGMKILNTIQGGIMKERVEEACKTRFQAKPKGIPNFRWTIGIMLFLGISIQSVDRVNMAASLPVIAKNLGLNPSMVGLIMSSFFWTYVLFNIPGGIIVDKLKPRKTFTIVGIWWGITTLFTGLSNGFRNLLFARVFLGAGEAPNFPAAARSVRAWFPKRERGTASALYSLGNDGGIIVGMPLASWILVSYGWREVFYATAAISVMWALAWWCIYREPRKHQWLSEKELDYIEQTDEISVQPAASKIAGPNNKPQVKATWGSLLKHRQVWGLTLGYFCYPYLYAFFYTWLPSYLVKEHHFSLIKMGIYGMMPGISGLIGGLIGGRFTDAMVCRNFSLTIARKVPILIGMIGGAISIFAAGQTKDPITAVILLCFTAFIMRLAFGPIWATPTDIAPTKDSVGSISGIMNTAGNFGGGIVSPIITGIIVTRTGSFTPAFLVIAIVALFGAASFAFVTGPLQPLCTEHDNH